MAEIVELKNEDTIYELELMQKFQIFSKDEIKTIKKKREQFEYRLQRVSKNKDDLLKYVQYEMSLLKILKQRINEKGMQAKKNNIEYLVFTRINELFHTGIRRFPQDVRIWLTFIKFCKQVGYYTHVSRLLDQMLELHGATKPSLFKLAAKWEWDDNHSIERARKFIHQGLHLHKESEMLFVEGFRLELAFANMKREEAQEKGTLQTEEVDDPILKGQLADVIYESAIQKINDVSILVQLLKVAKQYPFATNLQEKIIREMETKYPSEELTWDTLAKRQLELPGIVKDKIAKCVATYQRGVEIIMTQKMWGLYLDYILEINEDTTTLPNFRKNCLTNAFDAACKANMLTEKHYLIWAQKVDIADRAQVLKFGTMKFPDSAKLWSALLKFHFARDDVRAAESVFNDIKTRNGIPQPANLWLLYLKYLHITTENSANVEKLWKEGAGRPDVGAILKGKYIEWVAVRKGIMAARREYLALVDTPPASLDLHIAMSKLEDAQPMLKLKSARLVYDKALSQFGQENTDVWMWYVRFEGKYGDPLKVPQLYERAIRTLRPDLTNGFVSEFNLNKADQANRLLSAPERSAFLENTPAS